MPAFFAPIVMLPQGWGHSVRISVSDEGVITHIEAGASAENATLLPGVVIPGMANLHSHAFQRAMAGLTEVAGNPQDSFWTWRELMYRMVEKLSPEQMGAIATRLYIDLLKGGYTQVAEFHYLHHDVNGKHYPAGDLMLQQLVVAADKSGIGQTLLPVLYSYAGFGAQPAQSGQKRFIQDVDRYLRQQQALAKALQNYPLINQGLCFHSLRAVKQEQMEDVLEASDFRLPVHLHIAEQEKEVEDCLAWSGERPVNWLYNRFAVDDRWCLIHATHLAADEVTQIVESRAVAGLCPTTEANLGDGIFPASDFIARGGHWGIGSDSHVSVSAREELRWLEYGQRLRDRRRNRIVLPELPQVGEVLWRQAAAGGAQACGVALGAIAPGYRADWLVLEKDAWLTHVEDYALINRWLFGGAQEHIKDVWVAGRQVITDRQHPLDEQSNSQFAQVMRSLQE